MGCDIHLSIERRRRKSSKDEDWRGVGFHGEFGSRIYGMFARIAGVRDYWEDEVKTEFKPRGLPDGMCWQSKMVFYYFVTDNEEAIEWGNNYCSKEDAERWVAKGYSRWLDDKHDMLTDPDHHSHSWLTTRELRQCFDDCFKQEDGTMKPFADYADWLGLVSLCEGIESTGEYECRVVFAFDN